MSDRNLKRLAYGVGYTFLAAGVLCGSILWSTTESLLPGFISVVGGFAIWFSCWLFLWLRSHH